MGFVDAGNWIVRQPSTTAQRIVIIMNHECTQRVAGEEVADKEDGDAVDWTVRSRGSSALSWMTAIPWAARWTAVMVRSLARRR